MEQKIISVLQRLDWPNSKNGMCLKYDLTASIQHELDEGWEVATAQSHVSDGDKQAIVTTTYILMR